MGDDAQVLAVRGEILEAAPFTVGEVHFTVQSLRIVGGIITMWASRMMYRSGRSNAWRLLDEFNCRVKLAVDRLVQKSLALTMLPQNHMSKLQAENRAVKLGDVGTGGGELERAPSFVQAHMQKTGRTRT